jgi:hypothetical protein
LLKKNHRFYLKGKIKNFKNLSHTCLILLYSLLLIIFFKKILLLLKKTIDLIWRVKLKIIIIIKNFEKNIITIKEKP